MRRFKEHDERAVSYALKVWINPDGFKAKLVAYLVNQHRHFGHTTTSTVEASHAAMKRYLLCSTGDLRGVFQRLQQFWEDQEDRITNAQNRGRNKVLMEANSPLFAQV